MMTADPKFCTQDGTAPVYSAREFAAWLVTAKAGDRCCYWVGQLAADSGFHGKDGTTNLLGAAARHAGERGDVFLLQKQLGEFEYRKEMRVEYAYLAIKASESARHLARSEAPIY